jgi:hypothetical protein
MIVILQSDTCIDIFPNNTASNFRNCLINAGNFAKVGIRDIFLPPYAGDEQQLYITSSFIEPIQTGDTLQGILAVLPITKTESPTHVNFSNPIFADIKAKRVTHIDIQIKDAGGKFIKFNKGHCTIVLDLKQ